MASVVPGLHREQLIARFQSAFADRTPGSRAIGLVCAVEWFVAEEGRAVDPVRRAIEDGVAIHGSRIPLVHAFEAWLIEAPRVRRSAWLVDRLAAAVGIAWEPIAAPPTGRIALPRGERDQFERRLERRFESAGDPPEASELTDIVSDWLMRLGRRCAPLAARLHRERFAERRSERPDLTFTELLDRRLRRRQPTGGAAVIDFVQDTLQIEWQ